MVSDLVQDSTWSSATTPLTIANSIGARIVSLPFISFHSYLIPLLPRLAIVIDCESISYLTNNGSLRFVHSLAVVASFLHGTTPFLLTLFGSLGLCSFVIIHTSLGPITHTH